MVTVHYTKRGFLRRQGVRVPRRIPRLVRLVRSPVYKRLLECNNDTNDSSGEDDRELMMQSPVQRDYFAACRNDEAKSDMQFVDGSVPMYDGSVPLSCDAGSHDDGNGNVLQCVNEGLMPPSDQEEYDVNEKVYAWDGGALYEAKILKKKYQKENSAEEWEYLVHYLGYKKSYDRWLNSTDMMKMNAANHEYYCKIRGHFEAHLVRNDTSSRVYDGDQSIKDLSRTGYQEYQVNEQVYAWERAVLYEAKVLKKKSENEDSDHSQRWKYLVHFVGYKKSHDRWLTPSSMLKMNDANQLYYYKVRGLPVEEKDVDDCIESEDTPSNKSCEGPRVSPTNVFDVPGESDTFPERIDGCSIEFDGSPLSVNVVRGAMTLLDVRQKIRSKFNGDYFFQVDGSIISKKMENAYLVDTIIDDSIPVSIISKLALEKKDNARAESGRPLSFDVVDNQQSIQAVDEKDGKQARFEEDSANSEDTETFGINETDSTTLEMSSKEMTEPKLHPQKVGCLTEVDSNLPAISDPVFSSNSIAEYDASGMTNGGIRNTVLDHLEHRRQLLTIVRKSRIVAEDRAKELLCGVVDNQKLKALAVDIGGRSLPIEVRSGMTFSDVRQLVLCDGDFFFQLDRSIISKEEENDYLVDLIVDGKVTLILSARLDDKDEAQTLAVDTDNAEQHQQLYQERQRNQHIREKIAYRRQLIAWAKDVRKVAHKVTQATSREISPSQNLSSQAPRRYVDGNNVMIESVELFGVNNTEQALVPKLSDIIENPRENDVLFRRGTCNHPGTIDQKKAEYHALGVSSSDLKAKKVIRKNMIQQIKDRGGRFLERSSSGSFVMVDDVRADAKIAGRFGKRKLDLKTTMAGTEANAPSTIAEQTPERTTSSSQQTPDKLLSQIQEPIDLEGADGILLQSKAAFVQNNGYDIESGSTQDAPPSAPVRIPFATTGTKQKPHQLQFLASQTDNTTKDFSKRLSVDGNIIDRIALSHGVGYAPIQDGECTREPEPQKTSSKTPQKHSGGENEVEPVNLLRANNTEKALVPTSPVDKNDVLFLRGKVNHPGTIYFRTLLEQKVAKYQTLSFGKRKDMRKDLIQHIKDRGGRFLEHGQASLERRSIGRYFVIVDDARVDRKLATKMANIMTNRKRDLKTATKETEAAKDIPKSETSAVAGGDHAGGEQRPNKIQFLPPQPDNAQKNLSNRVLFDGNTIDRIALSHGVEYGAFQAGESTKEAKVMRTDSKTTTIETIETTEQPPKKLTKTLEPTETNLKEAIVTAGKRAEREERPQGHENCCINEEHTAKKCKTGPIIANESNMFISKMKQALADRPQNYKEFLDLTRQVKTKQIDTNTWTRNAVRLLQGHDHLILGFLTFLPENDDSTMLTAQQECSESSCGFLSAVREAKVSQDPAKLRMVKRISNLLVDRVSSALERCESQLTLESVTRQIHAEDSGMKTFFPTTHTLRSLMLACYETYNIVAPKNNNASETTQKKNEADLCSDDENNRAESRADVPTGDMHLSVPNQLSASDANTLHTEQYDPMQAFLERVQQVCKDSPHISFGVQEASKQAESYASVVVLLQGHHELVLEFISFLPDEDETEKKASNTEAHQTRSVLAVVQAGKEQNSPDIAIVQCISKMLANQIIESVTGSDRLNLSYILRCLHKDNSKLSDLIPSTNALRELALALSIGEDNPGRHSPVQTMSRECIRQQLAHLQDGLDRKISIERNNDGLTSKGTSNYPIITHTAERNVKEAYKFVHRVKSSFAKDPKVYNEYVRIINQINTAQGADRVGLARHVISLIHGHDDLVLGYLSFLPGKDQGTESVMTKTLTARYTMILAQMMDTKEKVKLIAQPLARRIGSILESCTGQLNLDFILESLHKDDTFFATLFPTTLALRALMVACYQIMGEGKTTLEATKLEFGAGIAVERQAWQYVWLHFKANDATDIVQRLACGT